MAILRFKRCSSEPNKGVVETGGSSYYLIDQDNNAEKVGFSERRSTKNLLYRIWPGFRARFSAVLPVGSLDKWHAKLDFEAWIHRLMYFTFANGSRENNRIPWFIKKVVAGGNLEMPFVPACYEHVFHNGHDGSWIVIQSGWKVYPVQLIENRAMEGWKEFWDDHHVGVNFTLMFGSEREWIFDVLIFNDQGDRVSYPWTQDVTLVNVVRPPPGRLTTAFPSSMLVASSYQFQFGHYYVCVDTFNQELSRRLQGFVQDDDIVHVWLFLGDCQYPLEKDGGCFEQESIAFLAKTLKLRPGDFIFMAVAGFDEVKVVVFRNDGTERHYFWYRLNRMAWAHGG